MSEILLDFVDQLVGDDENVLDLFLGSGNEDRNNNENDNNDNANTEAPPSSTTDMQAWLSSVNTNEENTNETAAAAGGGTLLSLPPVEDYCTMPTELFEANYTGQVEPFQNTSVIHWMHTIPPRFGQTNNISALLLGTDQQQNDYVTGLVAAPLLVFFFFLVWGLVLVVLRYCAPTNSVNAVRWLGGQPLRMPSPPMGGGVAEERDHQQQLQKTKTTHYDPHEVAKNDDYQAWRHDYQRTKVQLFVLRIPVWFAGMAIAIAALIMSVYGVDSLHNTLETGRESLLITGTLAQEATKIVDSIIAQNQQLSEHLFDLLEQVNTLCPLVRDPLCDDVYNIATCDLSALGFGPDLTAIIHMAGTHFVEGNTSSIYQEIVKAKSALEEVVDLTIQVDQSAAQLNWVLSFSMVMSLLLAGICLVILLGLLCPEVPKVLQFLQSKIMIPLFVILVVFAYILSIVFVTGSIVTADVCVYTSPHDNIDERILSVLARTPIQDMLGPIVLEFLSFYIHQCPVDELPQDIVEQLSYIEAGIPLIGQFSTIVEESTNVIQGVCGFETNQTEALLDVAETIQVQLCSITDILGDIRNFMQCSNWYPLYETTVYETLCYDGTKGFAYVATTQFVIVFCSFLILTFRVAFWNIQVGDEYYDFIDDDDDDDDNKNENENSNTPSENKNNSNSNKHNDEVAEYYKGMRGRVVPSSSTAGTTKTLSSRNKSQQQRVGPTTATAPAPVLATTTARHTQQQRHEQQKQHSWQDRQGKIREMQQRRQKGGGGEHTTSNENTKRNNTTNSIAAAATSAVADSRGSSSTAAILHDLNLSSSLLSNDDTAGTAMLSVPTNESFENNKTSKTEPSFPSTSWFTTMITTNDDDDDDNALQNNNNNSHHSSAFAADRFASSFKNSQLNVSYDDRNDDNEDPAPPLDWFGGGAMSAIFSFFNNDDTPEENATEIRRNSQYPSRRLQRNGTRSTNNNLHRTYHHHEQDEKDDIAYPNIEIEPNFNKSMMTKPTAAVDAWSMWANQPQYSDDTDDR